MIKKNYKKRILLSLIVILAFMLSYLYYLFVYRSQNEPETTAKSTGTHAAVYTLNEMIDHLTIYDEYFSAAQKKNLKEQTEFGTYIIPGLDAALTVDTKDKKPAVCTSMTPQGLAVTEDYIVISAYCHTKKHNSSLYMLDKKSHHFVKEVILPDSSHAGGLAYDPIYRNLWISGRSKNTAYANAYTIEELEAYSIEKSRKPLPYSIREPLYGLTRNSFMTYSGGYLYAGFFSLNGDSVVYKYHVDNEGGLEKVYSSKLAQDMNIMDKVPIPESLADISAKVQGITFYEDYMLLSQSYGPLKSTLRIFKTPPDELTHYDFKDNKAIATYKMPRQMEQIYAADGKVYILFESSAYAYRAHPGASMDRVLTLDITDEYGEVIENEPSTKLFTKLRARDINEEIVTSKAFADNKVNMIYIWSPENEFCVDQLKDLEELYQGYRGDPVGIMGLVIDDSTKTRQAELAYNEEVLVREILDDSDVTFRQLTLPANLVNTRIGQAGHFPTIYFLDSEGNVIDNELYGSPSIKALKQQIDNRLAAVEKAEKKEREKRLKEMKKRAAEEKVKIEKAKKEKAEK